MNADFSNPSAHPGDPGAERLLDLLADRAATGLNGPDEAEMWALLEQHPDLSVESFDRAAAAAAEALRPVNDPPLPAALRARLERGAAAWGAMTLPEPKPAVVGRIGPGSGAASALAPSRRPAILPWTIAACAALAAGILLIRPPQPATPGGLSVQPVSLVEQRRKMMDRPDAIVVPWSIGKPDALCETAATGDVVWCSKEQRGFMRFKGLKVNDPREVQYQLWIFCTNQEERFPVNGGIFDIDAATGEVLVEIRPSIHVVNPTLFAITVEKPGGVWVSSRERLPLVAPVKKG
ncbi:MAG: hypothetical protein IBJ11_04690 [Phycisphaerales bacterium]|nr:hypothetical protein [Phycisphaerales bacterium]